MKNMFGAAASGILVFFAGGATFSESELLSLLGIVVGISCLIGTLLLSNHHGDGIPATEDAMDDGDEYIFHGILLVKKKVPGCFVVAKTLHNEWRVFNLNFIPPYPCRRGKVRVNRKGGEIYLEKVGAKSAAPSSH